MPRNLRILFIGFLVFLTACQSQSDFSVMTYNIRLDIAVDGDNAWPLRKDLLSAQLQDHAPDIFGVQEAMPGQMDFIDQKMPGHNYIGHGRDGGHSGEYSAIFYNRAIFSVAQGQTFWLSKTPDKKSMGWDAGYPRICTYGLFTHQKTGQKIWVFNTHLDHIGELARRNGIVMIVNKIEEVNTGNIPVIFMGDFNVDPDDPLIIKLKEKMDDSEDISIETSNGPEATFNAFQPIEHASRRIDYIMLSKSSNFTVKAHNTLYDETALQYPSDHFPVLAVLSLKQ